MAKEKSLVKKLNVTVDPKTKKSSISMDSLTPEEKWYINAVKNTCAGYATPAEFMNFLYLAEEYSLDPMKKEIMFIKSRAEARPIVMTTRDGYMKIAHSDIGYDGIYSGVLCEGDEFALDLMGVESPKHIITAGRTNNIIGAWAIARHKTRPPVVVFVSYEELSRANGSNPIWRKYPSDMIQKNAEVRALKRQYNISALVTEEELTIDESDFSATAKPMPIINTKPKKKVAKKEEVFEESVESTNDEHEKTIAEKVDETIIEPNVVAEEAMSTVENKKEPIKYDKKAVAKARKKIKSLATEMKWTPTMMRAYLSTILHVDHNSVNVDELNGVIKSLEKKRDEEMGEFMEQEKQKDTQKETKKEKVEKEQSHPLLDEETESPI